MPFKTIAFYTGPGEISHYPIVLFFFAIGEGERDPRLYETIFLYFFLFLFIVYFSN